MMGIFQVQLVTILVLLKLVSASIDINKTEYYKSLTPEERQEIFNTDDIDNVPEFEIIELEFPKVQKRSLDGIIPIRLALLNKNINLNLKLAAPIIGPNTPVYDIRSQVPGKVVGEAAFPFRDFIFNIYEDEDQLASVVVDTDANGNKYIRSGIIGAHNISIYRAPTHQNPRLQNSLIVNLINLFLFGTRAPIGNPVNTPTNSPIIVPNVIYPEILVMVDSSLYKKYINFDSFKNYILNFWITVNLKYKSLSHPKYKLSIAGIVVGEDRNAFNFISLYSSLTHLDFNGALNQLGRWLFLNKHLIPIESYDIAIAHTLLNSASINLFSTNVGIANVRSACKSNLINGVEKVAIVYDDGNYGSIYTAAHEIAHTLGAYHDDNTGCMGRKFIMSSVNPVNSHQMNLRWSQCSVNGMHDFLGTNPECLYNVPEPYLKQIQATKAAIDNIYYNNGVNADFTNARNGDYNNENSKIEMRQFEPRQVGSKDVVPYTNTRYIDLTDDKVQYQLQLQYNFEEIQIVLHHPSFNKIIHMQIIDKQVMRVFLLDKNTEYTSTPRQNELLGNNGILIGNNNRGSSNGFSLNNRELSGNMYMENGQWRNLN